MLSSGTSTQLGAARISIRSAPISFDFPSEGEDVLVPCIVAAVLKNTTRLAVLVMPFLRVRCRFTFTRSSGKLSNQFLPSSCCSECSWTSDGGVCARLGQVLNWVGTIRALCSRSSSVLCLAACNEVAVGFPSNSVHPFTRHQCLSRCKTQPFPSLLGEWLLLEYSLCRGRP